jgi:hypothetical protein
MEENRLVKPAADCANDSHLSFAPIVVQPCIPDIVTLSRATSIDSCASASKSGSDLFVRQSGSRLSTRSALSALLAAADNGHHVRRSGSSECGDSDASGGVVGIGSRDVHYDDIDVANSNGTTDVITNSMPSGDDGTKNSISGSHSSVPSDKSNSRSSSISQCSVHSASDGGLQRRRTSRITEGDAPSSFVEHLHSRSESPHSHHAQSHHTLASESARRILASASFDSDLSDGGMGSEYAPHHEHAHERSELDDFVCSEEEEEDEEVAEFDEFEDFNAIEASFNRSGSSAGNLGASADSWDEEHNRSASTLTHTAPAWTHELTCKQLMLLVLSAEVVFEKPAKTSVKTPTEKAANFMRSSRNSLVGSLVNMGLTIKTARSGSDGSIQPTPTVLQQNLANATASSPRKPQRKSPAKAVSPRASSAGSAGNSNSSIGTGGSPREPNSATEALEAERLVRQRLCVFPAEDDGTPMDDLPEYSINTNMLRSGEILLMLLLKGSVVCITE